MFRSTLSGVAALCVATPAVAHVAPAPLSLLPLRYAAAALAPAIDTETMAVHHDRHRQAYVDTLNKAVATDPTPKRRSLDAPVAKAGTLPAFAHNNAGGHRNLHAPADPSSVFDAVGARS